MEEAGYFVIEIESMKQLLTKLPIDILEHQSIDVADELRRIDELEIALEKKRELKKSLESYKVILDKEIEKRIQ